MPRARDLLERFRPVGTPGAAAPAGVPADRVAELTRELAPVFELLTGTEVESARIRDAATGEARARRRRAAEEASRIVAAARRDAEAHRVEAATRVGRMAAQETMATIAAAEREATLIRRRSRERIGPYLERVVAAVRLGSVAGPTEGRVP
jgi:hypothetical protein